MDQYGNGIEVRQQDLWSVCASGISLNGWTMDKFRWMCILSGCDYLPSIPGMGLKTAYKYLCVHKTMDQVWWRSYRLEQPLLDGAIAGQVFHKMRYSSSLQVPAGYEQR